MRPQHLFSDFVSLDASNTFENFLATTHEFSSGVPILRHSIVCGNRIHRQDRGGRLAALRNDITCASFLYRPDHAESVRL
jgi:hypothetical protein